MYKKYQKCPCLRPDSFLQSLCRPGESKLKPDADEVLTMPIKAQLSAKPFDYSLVQHVESFVGLTLSGDGEY